MNSEVRTAPSRTSRAVLVICVNFHNDEMTRRLVGDLLLQQGVAKLKIVLVDNGCNKDSSSSLRNLTSDDPQVHVMEPGMNLGYFGGADYALSRHLAEDPLPEWVVVSNPDIRIPAPDFFEQVLNLYTDRPPGIVAPAILSVLSRTDQNPYLRRRPSRTRMHFYKWLFRFRLAARGYQRTSLLKLRILRGVAPLKVPVKLGVAPEPIYAAHGSFMLFHRSYFEAGGSLRHGTFLFGEEIFVAETARRLGVAIFHNPRLVVEHEQGTPNKILRDRALQTYARDAAAFVAREYF